MSENGSFSIRVHTSSLKYHFCFVIWRMKSILLSNTQNIHHTASKILWKINKTSKPIKCAPLYWQKQKYFEGIKITYICLSVNGSSANSVYLDYSSPQFPLSFQNKIAEIKKYFNWLKVCYTLDKFHYSEHKVTDSGNKKTI